MSRRVAGDGPRHDDHDHDLVESQIQANNRFPDRNPNPVLRVSGDGHLTYANESSAPIRRALGVEVGGRLTGTLMRRLRAAARAGDPLELRDDGRTFSVLVVAVPELGFLNLYGSDISAEKAVERFPNENPNPVFRIDGAGRLLYANTASQPLVDAYGLKVGDSWPADIAQRILASADSGTAARVELEAGYRTYALHPVRIAELGFINVYGTDVTGEKVVAKFPSQNPNPVLRLDEHGTLIYANPASAPIVAALGLVAGQRLPAGLLRRLRTSLRRGRGDAVECAAGGLVFELSPVAVPEFGSINVYGTDVTAARQVAQAKEETERLLLNILPPPIADRLRSGERVIADRFEDASLLIADIVGFTELSSRLTPDQLVELLNDIFSVCDALVERHGLEKVKTIGDAYMVIGGVPTASPDHLERLADFALDMAVAVDDFQRWATQRADFRVGINCGPVVAGVIGSKRTIYDVWGDTVNIASRMESLSEPGRIQVSAPVHDRLLSTYDFESRGRIEVKGKGTMPTWYLVGRR